MSLFGMRNPGPAQQKQELPQPFLVALAGWYNKRAELPIYICSSGDTVIERYAVGKIGGLNE